LDAEEGVLHARGPGPLYEHGRTEEEEQKALAQRLQVGRQLYWMLRKGYSMQEVLDHFRKHSQTEERRNKKLKDRASGEMRQSYLMLNEGPGKFFANL
jgi:hypothetical protein